MRRWKKKSLILMKIEFTKDKLSKRVQLGMKSQREDKEKTILNTTKRMKKKKKCLRVAIDKTSEKSVVSRLQVANTHPEE